MGHGRRPAPAAPHRQAPTGRLVEVACDESGSEGENLVGGNTDVFAHASVRLTAESAADCIREIRDRIRSPALEYKAGHLLREKHRPVLTWLLGPSGPMAGHAHVHLTDKAFFVVDRVVEVLLGDDAGAAAAARTLYREGPRVFSRDRWRAFLEASNALVRTRSRWDAGGAVDAFFRAVDALRDGGGGPASEVLALLRRARPRADAFRARLDEDPGPVPALDPLLPAIARAVAWWGQGKTPVSVVHDEHVALGEDRVAQLEAMLGAPPGGRLAGLRLVDSRSDARVQVADFLAGVARKIASDELNHRGDAELTGLLRPYVDASSIWGDERSWSLLGPRR
jgi:hypothetical protein